MRAHAHTRTHGLTPRPALLRCFAAPRQLPATHFSLYPGGPFRTRSAPGWRLTAQLPKVILKCRKVAKSLEVKKIFPNFAANLKTKLMTVQEFFKKYEVDNAIDLPIRSCELCALKKECDEYFEGCPLPPFYYFKLK